MSKVVCLICNSFIYDEAPIDHHTSKHPDRLDDLTNKKQIWMDVPDDCIAVPYSIRFPDYLNMNWGRVKSGIYGCEAIDGDS